MAGGTPQRNYDVKEPSLASLPLMLPAAMLVAGVVLHDCGVAWPLMIIAAAITGCVCLWRRYNRLMTLLLWMCGGYLTALVHQPALPPEMADVSPCQWSAEVVDVNLNESTGVMTARVDSCANAAITPFKACIIMPRCDISPIVTSRVQFRAALSQIEPTAPDLPDETDYKALMLKRGITAQAIVLPGDIEVTGEAQGLFSRIRRWQYSVMEAIARLGVADGTSRFLTAILTGNRDNIDTADTSLFTNTGVVHILALSGLHTGIIGGMIYLMLMPLALTPLRRGRRIIAVAAMWIFAIMTGLGVSVVRAVTMLSMLALADMLQRPVNSLNALFAAMIVTVAFVPAEIYSPGFQLSFAAVAAILLLAPRMDPWSRAGKMPPWWLSVITVTIAATAGTSLLTLYHFHRFPVWFLPANLGVAFLLPAILIIGLILLVLASVGINAIWLCRVEDALYQSMTDWIALVGRLPGIESVQSEPGLAVLLLAAGALVMAGFALWNRHTVASTAAAAMLATAAGVLYATTPAPPQRMEIFIPRLTEETLLMVRAGEEMECMSTLPPHLSMAQYMSRKRWRRYMERRRIAGLRHADVSSELIRTERDVVSIGGKRFMLLNRNTGIRLPADRRIDYAVVCRGFNGDIGAVMSKLRPDTVVLTADLRLHHHESYSRYLDSINAPYVSLRQGGLTILP